MLAYASFFLLVFISAVSVFLYIQSQDAARAEHAYAQEIAYSFADGIKTAFAAGPGFTQKVALEPSILGKPYSILVSMGTDPATMETGLAYVSWASSQGLASVSAPTVTTSYSLTERRPYIYYEGGLVLINSTAMYVNITNDGGTIRFKA